MGSQEYLFRQCPICQKNAQHRIEVSSEKKAEEMGYEKLTPYWNGFFKDKIFFSYARCRECDLLFTPTFYRLDQLEALYAQMPPNMDLVPMAALVRTQKGYFEVLKKSSTLKNGYIEIGPDIGIFTENCSREGRFDSYWLCEPNTEVADALAKSIGSRKFTIIEDMFGFTKIPVQSAGVAVMIQVLDHLLDPVATLTELKTKLLPNAKLLLVTHNERSILRRIIGWRWPAFCLQHPQIYNPASIKKLLEKSGYRVESIRRSTNYFQFSFLLKHLLWAFGIKVKSVPSFFNFTIGLKLGNIITIATPN
ncbi:class I SAM-dependent methyltransferase [Polynucleobacter paneuropaeus]|nr:class I SAM-dependent methyltransferase [Polynucleobacter paneuropaeus]MBT8637576.1 class I SAM-dependent methyltransferase [Polynucleobacter paneuropaeus]